MMVKIKIIEDIGKGKAGKIYESSKKSAEDYVSQGFAVYVDEVKKTKTNSIKKVVDEYYKKEGVSIEQAITKEQSKNKIIPRFIELCSKENISKFTEKRKYNPEILEKLKVGFCNSDVYFQLIKEFERETIQASPLMKSGKMSFIGQVIIPHNEHYFSIKPGKFSLTGAKQPFIIEGKQPVIVCEGQTDAIALHHIYPEQKIIGLGGVSSQKPLNAITENKVWICFDTDKAGQEWTLKAVEKLYGKEVSQIKFEKYHDIDDLFRENQDKSVNLLELVKLEAPKTKPNTKTNTIVSKEGTAQGNRNNNCFELAVSYKKKNLDKEEVFSLLLDWNKKNDPPLEEAEVKSVVESCFSSNTSSTKKREIKEEKSKDNYLNITKFNRSTKVFMGGKAEIYNHQTPIKVNDSIYYKTEYSLYEGITGQGNRPIFILSKYKVDLGDNKLFLSELSSKKVEELLWGMKNGFLYYTLCKKMFIPTTKGKGKEVEKRSKEEVISELLSYDLTFFELVLPISKDEIKKLDNPFETITKIMKNGLIKDEKLDYIYISNIPQVNPHLIKPQNYMRFADHSIIITNEKTGKTSSAISVTDEIPFEKPSEAGLLGFAGADSRTYGVLHQRCKHSYIEEIQEEKGEELFGKLHTFMEMGETIVARGIGIKIEGHSGITFQGNPKTKNPDDELTEYLMIKEFREILYIISKNVKPFSSRIGLTLFDKNLKAVEGTPNDNDKTEKGRLIIRCIAEGFRDEFTELFFNDEIFEWLNQPFDKEYINNLKSCSLGCGDKVISDYLLGQINSYRHTRGIALRLGWLETGILDVFQDRSVNIQKLIESSEKHFEKIKRINTQSYSNIISLVNSEMYDTLLRYNLENLKPEYIRLSIYTLLDWLIDLDNKERTDRVIPLTMIESNYNNVKEMLGIKRTHKYRSFTTIIKYYEDCKNKTDLEEFGLEYDKTKKCFVIIDKEIIQKFKELYNTLWLQRLQRLQTDKIKGKNKEKEKVTMVTKVTTQKKVVTNVTGNLRFPSENVFSINKYEDLIQFVKANPKTRTQPILDNCSPEFQIDQALTKAKEKGDLMNLDGNSDKWVTL